MFRIKNRRILPLVALILLLLVFLLPEINLLVQGAKNLIANTCVIQKLAGKECEQIIVNNVYPETISMSLKEQPTFVFVTNVKLENIDRQNSNFDILLIYADSYYSKVVSLTDSNVTLTSLDTYTEIKLTYPEKITEIIPILTQVFVYDNKGNSGHNSVYSSTAQNFFDYFLERASYLLQYLIWYFVIFGGAIRGIPWSIVYDSKTKEPIKGAIIRIFKDGKLYNTMITDVNGIFKIQPEKGVYTINVIKAGYVFPSALKPLRVDEEYSNLYYGEEIRIINEHTNLKVSVPLDSQTYVERSNIVKKTINSVTSMLSNMTSYFIIVMTVFQILVWPTYRITYAFAVIAITLISLQYYMRRKSDGQPGLVVNQVGTPLVDIKIDLYEAEWDKKVDSMVTNEKGEFEFVVPIKKYYLMLDNAQYKIFGADSDGKYHVTLDGTVGRVLRVNRKLVLERIEKSR